MTHINRRLNGDFISAAQEPISVIQPHQIAAAVHPEKHTKTLSDRRMLSRQALERKINDQLSKQARRIGASGAREALRSSSHW